MLVNILQPSLKKYNYVPVPFWSTRRSPTRKPIEGLSMVSLRRRISPNDEAALRVIY